MSVGRDHKMLLISTALNGIAATPAMISERAEGGGGGGGRKRTLFYKDCSLGSVKNLTTCPC